MFLDLREKELLEIKKVLGVFLDVLPPLVHIIIGVIVAVVDLVVQVNKIIPAVFLSDVVESALHGRDKIGHVVFNFGHGFQEVLIWLNLVIKNVVEVFLDGGDLCVDSTDESGNVISADQFLVLIEDSISLLLCFGVLLVYRVREGLKIC